MKYENYLSFGFLCEVSFVLQEKEIFTPAFLSWADVRGTDALIDALECPEKIFSNEYVTYSGNMFFCKNAKIGFHGRKNFSECVNSDGSKNNDLILDSLHETKDRIKYLHAKTMDILKRGSNLIIVKWVNDIFEENYSPYESGVKLIDFLRKNEFNNNDVLYVFEKGNKYCNWSLSNFYGREIESFALRSSASNFNINYWNSVLDEFI